MGRIWKKLITIFVGLVLVFSIFAGSGIQVNADESDVRGFIERLYTLILEREPDEVGVDYWIHALSNGTNATTVTDFFFNSPEMIARNLNDSDFVDIAYLSLLDREADDSGKNYWLSAITNGSPRQRIVECFLDSPEFAQICRNYGMTGGVIDTTGQVQNKADFVRQLYLNIFEREPVNSEINFWISLLDSGKTATDLVLLFVGSNEFNANGISNSQYVQVCYRALMGREGTTDEILYWAGYINNGHRKNDVLAIFLASPEFADLCASLGITKGEVAGGFISEIDDSTITPQQRFVKRVYLALFSRDPSRDELNSWGSRLSSGTSAAVFIQTLVYSDSYINTASDKAVDDIYTATIGRTTSGAPRQRWITRLNTDMEKYGLINYLVSSEEFVNLCRTYEVTSGYIDLSNKCTWTTHNGQRALKDARSGYWVDCGWVFADGLRYFFSDQGQLVQNTDPILGKQSEYYLTVNTTTNVVTVYARTYAGGSFDTPVKAMICSCGVADSPTINGTFTLRPLGRWSVLMGDVWGQYCTQISGNYLFHSVWYYEQGNIRSITVSGFSQLGRNASHGCVRLTVEDAKWIFENCGGSRVNVSTSQPQPFDKPAAYSAVSVGGDYGYDPHDPGL